MEERKVPTHIGIIMDGNGRWAKQRGLPRSEGHKAGAKVFKQICDYAGEIGVQSITFYAFSTENWKRPPEEVSSLMDLFREYMHEAEDRKAENLQKGMRMHFIGHREGIPEDLLNLFDTSEEESRGAENTMSISPSITAAGLRLSMPSNSSAKKSRPASLIRPTSPRTIFPLISIPQDKATPI